MSQVGFPTFMAEAPEDTRNVPKKESLGKRMQPCLKTGLQRDFSVLLTPSLLTPAGSGQKGLLEGKTDGSTGRPSLL